MIFISLALVVIAGCFTAIERATVADTNVWECFFAYMAAIFAALQWTAYWWAHDKWVKYEEECAEFRGEEG